MSEKPIARYIPLIQTVREIDKMAQVWFEVTGGVLLPVSEGDLVTIRGRVFEVKRAGGYVRSGDDEQVKRRDAFALDLGEIFLDQGTLR